jgi:hypothetical protein
MRLRGARLSICGGYNVASRSISLSYEACAHAADLPTERIGGSIMLTLHPTRNTSGGPTTLAEHIAAHCRDRGHTDEVTRILRLAEAEAWTDAALALIELELPRWTLRRLAHEDGEWFCWLSRRPELPIELDDCAEARSELPVLAILDALAEARRKDCVAPMRRANRAAPPPTVTPTCDNFG